MKNEINIAQQDNQDQRDLPEVQNNIDRRTAIKKAGFISLSATTMMVLLGKPDKALTESLPSPPGW